MSLLPWFSAVQAFAFFFWRACCADAAGTTLGSWEMHYDEKSSAQISNPAHRDKDAEGIGANYRLIRPEFDRFLPVAF